MNFLCTDVIQQQQKLLLFSPRTFQTETVSKTKKNDIRRTRIDILNGNQVFSFTLFNGYVLGSIHPNKFTKNITNIRIYQDYWESSPRGSLIKIYRKIKALLYQIYSQFAGLQRNVEHLYHWRAVDVYIFMIFIPMQVSINLWSFQLPKLSSQSIVQMNNSQV